MIKYIRNVARRRRRDKTVVEQIERTQGLQYKKEKSDAALEKIAQELAQQKANLELRKSKLRPKFGKMKMQRSRKPSVQRKKVEKEIDPEKMAFIQYLGHLSEEDDGTAAQV